MSTKALLHPALGFAGLTLIALASSQAATITQTVNQGAGANYNAAIYGSPAAAPTAGNAYVSGTGFTADTGTGVGTNFSGTIRNSGNNTFAGDSLTIVTDSRFQLSTGTATVNNLIIDGGTIGTSATGVILAGNTTVNTSAYLSTGSTQATTFNSTLSGGGTFYLRAGDTTPSLTFGGPAAAFNGFTGTLNVGFNDPDGMVGRLLVDFSQAYTIPGGIVDDPAGSNTQDILSFDSAVTVKSFQFGGVSLAPNTYTAAQLDAQFGTTGRFTGAGTLTVAPEPSTWVGMAVLAGFFGFVRRRMMGAEVI